MDRNEAIALLCPPASEKSQQQIPRHFSRLIETGDKDPPKVVFEYTQIPNTEK